MKSETITKDAKDIQKLVESQITLEKKVHDDFDIEKEPVFDMTKERVNEVFKLLGNGTSVTPRSKVYKAKSPTASLVPA